MRPTQTIVAAATMLAAALVLFAAIAGCTPGAAADRVDSVRQQLLAVEAATTQPVGQAARTIIVAAAPGSVPWLEIGLAALAAINGLLGLASSKLHASAQKQLAESIPLSFVQPEPPGKPPGPQFPAGFN